MNTAQAFEAYARRGLHVLPLRPGGKSPHPVLRASSDGQRGGVYRASCNPEDVKDWSRLEPPPNVGVRLGVEWPQGSGRYLAVLDLDVKAPDIADRVREVLSAETLRLETWLARTPSGGGHLWLLSRQPVDTVWLASEDGQPVGELRGRGAYVVVPPSEINGRRYEWLSPLGEDGLPKGRPAVVEDALEYALELLAEFSIEARPKGTHHGNGRQGEKGYRKALNGEVIPEGMRHDVALYLAGLLARFGVGKEVAAALLEAVREKLMAPGSHPVTDPELAAIVAYCYAREEAKANGQSGAEPADGEGSAASTASQHRLQRQPAAPFSKELEEAVISAALNALQAPDGRALLASALGELAPLDFFDPFCRAVWEALRRLHAEHGAEGLTWPMLSAALREAPEGSGVADRLRELMTLPHKLPAAIGLNAAHRRGLKELAQRRRLSSLGQRLAAEACNGRRTDELVAEMVAALQRESAATASPAVLRTAADVLAEAKQGIAWVWAGFLARGETTLLAGLPKGGKSTLLWHLVAALLKGQSEFLGQPLATGAGRAAVFTEEPPSIVADERLRKLGLDSDRLLVAFRSDVPTLEATMAAIANGASGGLDLVVIDTLGAFAALEDENDAAEIERRLRPLALLAQQHRFALLLAHHLRKTPGDDGTQARGSTALVGLADTVIELRRYEGQGSEHRRRLVALGRHSETPAEIVIELRPEGYRFLGSGQRAAFIDLVKAIKAVLPEDRPGLTERELREQLAAAGYQAPHSSVGRALQWLIKEGAVLQEGRGRGADAFRYRRAAP